MDDPQNDLERIKDLDFDIEDLDSLLGDKVQYLITLEGKLSSDIPPKAVCGCGEESEPNTDLYKLGIWAKRHQNKTGHLMRPHDIER